MVKDKAYGTVEKQKSKAADAAYKKKSIIKAGIVLLVFILGIAAVLFYAWYNGNRRYDQFVKDSQRAQALSQKRRAGETVEGIDIEINDDNYYYWITELDASYQAPNHSRDYGKYDGCTIHLQGIFKVKEYVNGKIINYWVVRNYEQEYTDRDTGKKAVYEQELPIEVIFDGDIPKDGDWVDVTGAVALDSTNSLSAVRDAKLTVIEPQDILVK